MGKFYNFVLVLLGIVVIGSLMFISSAMAQEDSWWARDKAYHLSVSFGLASAAYSFFWTFDVPSQTSSRPWIRPIISTSTALIPGLAKEFYDAAQSDNHFSGKDLTWDFIGSASGSLVMYSIERICARPPRTPFQESRTYLYISPNKVLLRSVF